MVPNTCTISSRPLIFYQGSLTHHSRHTAWGNRGRIRQSAQLLIAPGIGGNPAPTNSRLTPPVCYLQTLCLPGKKPSRTNNKPQINNRPQRVPLSSAPSSRRRAQFTPLVKKSAPSPPESPRRERTPKTPDLQDTNSRQLLSGPDVPATRRILQVYLPLGCLELHALGAHALGAQAGSGRRRERACALRSPAGGADRGQQRGEWGGVGSSASRGLKLVDPWRCSAVAQKHRERFQ